MRLSRQLVGGLVCCLLFGPATVQAETPPNPFRLVSDQADLIIEVKNLRHFVEAFTTLDAVKGLLALEPVQEVYDSTNVRRFYQLVAYFEKEMGAQWPDLLDQLGGGGGVLGIKIGKPPQVLLVLQGKDEARVTKFAKLGLKILEDELTRQENKDKLEQVAYRDLETFHVGKDFHVAVAGSALLLANTDTALKSAIDLHRDGDKKSLAGSALLAEARKLLPADSLAMLWLNMENLKKAPEAKELFDHPRNNEVLTVIAGGWLDVAGRSPFVAAALHRQKEGLGLTVCLPRGSEGQFDGAVHIPPADASATRPLLEPNRVLSSTSFYLDFAQFWEQRSKLFNERQIKEFEAFNKKSGRFLLGTPFNKLIAGIGRNHRLVAVNQIDSGYKTKPKRSIPAFALVLELREPEKFTKSVRPILRSLGLLASTLGQANLKMVEEKHGDFTLIGYRFPEGSKVPGYEDGDHFNYSPCFVTVGDQFVVSSTLELGHELVDLLVKETKSSAKSAGPNSERSKLYAKGGAEYLRAIEDTLLTQTILDRALAPDTAKQQVRAFIDWVAQLGEVRIEATYGAKDFLYEIRLNPGK